MISPGNSLTKPPPFERGPKGQVYNWEGRILFLTRRPYALLRFPHFCLRWTPVFGYAYAVLTLSLWMTFCAQTRSGSLRTRLFCLQQDSASRRFGRRRWRRGAWASSFQSEVLPSAFCDMDNILWKHHEWIPRLVAFVALPIAVMVSLWAALWANEWASGQRDSWALRMPYAYLTHSLRKSLTIRWTKTGKIEGTTQTRDAYDWDNRMANLPLPLLHLWAWASVYLQRKEWKAITDWKYSVQLIQVEGPTSKPDTLRKRNLWEKLTHPYATQGFAYAHGSYDPPKTNQYMRGFGPCSFEG